MGKDVIIACDFPGASETLAFLGKFGELRPFVKIGMELYYAEGPDIVRILKQRGHRVFLDLKLHDIPNTVRKTMNVLRDLGADIVNVHAAGTERMMREALLGLTRPDGTRPLLIAVTMLTSTDQETMERDLLIREPLPEVVMHYAENAKKAGLDGIVCSPLEAADVHRRLGADFLTVTPGVRFKDGDIGDQKRVLSPEEAREAGSDYIVVGRPVTPWRPTEDVYWNLPGKPFRKTRNRIPVKGTRKQERKKNDSTGRENCEGPSENQGGVLPPGRTLHLGQRDQEPGLLRQPADAFGSGSPE